jgi:hypothetical protein
LSVNVLRIRDEAVERFEEWLEVNGSLFADSDEKRCERKQRELKKIRKTVEEVKNSTSIVSLLAFALWAQNYLSSSGVMFGMRAVDAAVLRLSVASPRIDVESSGRLAQALARVLQLQSV